MRKTPLEEKIEAMASSFEKLVDLLLKIPDNFDKSLSRLSAKIDHLDEKIADLSLKVNQSKERVIEENTKTQPPPPNPKLKVPRTHPSDSQVNPRVALMDELKSKFEKMKKGC